MAPSLDDRIPYEPHRTAFPLISHVIGSANEAENEGLNWTQRSSLNRLSSGFADRLMTSWDVIQSSACSSEHDLNIALDWYTARPGVIGRRKMRYDGLHLPETARVTVEVASTSMGFRSIV